MTVKEVLVELTVTPAVRKLSKEYSHLVTEPPEANPVKVKVVELVPEHTFTLPPVILPDGAPLMLISLINNGLTIPKIISPGMSPYSITLPIF